MKRPLAFFCLLFLVSAGIFFMLFPPHPPDFTDWENRPCTAVGKIAAIEKIKKPECEETLIYLKHISYFEKNFICAGNPAKHSQNHMIKKDGLICYLSQTEAKTTLSVGQPVKIKGRFLSFPPATNPGEFNAYCFYRTEGYIGKLDNARIISVSTRKSGVKNFLYRLRVRGENRIKTLYPQKEAGVLLTMLFGNKTGLDEGVKDSYRKAGILHILSVSGLHISILGYGFYRLLRKIRVPVLVSSSICILWIWAYGVMIGMGVSAFRAIIMFIIRMLAQWFKRTYDLLTALAVAAVLLVIKQPLYFYHSGFWLSFVCVLSIQVLYPLFSFTSHWKKTSFFLKTADSVLLSAVITAVTLPVFLWFYFEVSFWGILWNLFVLPLTGIVLSGGILSLMIPVSLTYVSNAAVWCVCVILGFFESTGKITDFLGKGMIILGRPSVFQIVIFAAGILALAMYGEKIKYRNRFLVLAVLTSVLFVRVPENFSMTVLDVGQGDGICIQNDTGKAYFIDGGSVSKSKVGKRILLPFLKSRGIDTVEAVFLSHADRDHMNGIMELLQMPEEGVHIKNIVLPALKRENLKENFPEILDLAMKSGTAIYTMGKGQEYRDGDMRMICLNPEPGSVGGGNEISQVFYLTYRDDFSILLTGDVEGKGELDMWQYVEEKELPPVSVLKVAHHGSKNSTPPGFLNTVSPEIALISAGRDNPYGHPHRETLERLSERKIKVFKTPESGSITVKVKKGKMHILEYLKKSRR